MCLQTLLWVCVLAAADPAEPKVLLVLSTGSDLYGEIVKEAAGDVFITRQGKPVRVDGRSIVKRLAGDEIDAEIKARAEALEKEDTAGYLQLALLFVEIGRPKESAPFIEKARECVKALKPPAKAKTVEKNGASGKDAKDKAGAKGAADAAAKEKANELAGLWPPPDGATFLLQVKRKVGGEVTDDGVRETRLRNLFMTGGTPLQVGEGTTADYVLRIGLEAEMLKENSYYGTVPVSKDWEGRVNCVVRHVKTGKEVFRMNAVSVRETLPLIAKDDEILIKTWEQFMRLLRNEAAFRFKKEENPNPAGVLRRL